MSVLGTNRYQWPSWCCERLYLASVNFSWKLFQCVCPFHGGWFTNAPTPTVLSVQFLTRNSVTPMPHPLFTWSHPKWLFCVFPWMKNVLKRKHFADVEEVKQKMAEALKGIKINKFKQFWAVGKNVKWRVLGRWPKFKHVRINTQFFINKFCFGGSPLYICYILYVCTCMPCVFFIHVHMRNMC